MTDNEGRRTAVPLPGELPFEGLFREAAAEARVLRRNDIYTSGPPIDLVSEEILDFVTENVGASVLDVGCGLGPYVERLTLLGKRCAGIDTNTEIVDRGRELGRDLRVMSAYELAFEEKSFDSVIMIETLEHLDDYRSALSEAARVASRSIVVTVPDISVLPLMSTKHLAPWHVLEGTHVNFFTPEILRRTLLGYAASCEVTRLGRFYDIGGQALHTHLAASARLA